MPPKALESLSGSVFVSPGVQNDSIGGPNVRWSSTVRSEINIISGWKAVEHGQRPIQLKARYTVPDRNPSEGRDRKTCSQQCQLFPLKSGHQIESVHRTGSGRKTR